MSPDIGRCPLGDKITPEEDHCFRVIRKTYGKQMNNNKSYNENQMGQWILTCVAPLIREGIREDLSEEGA